MNCKATIMEYLQNLPKGSFKEFTAAELSHRITVIPNGGPRYDLSTIRRALERLAWERKLERRWAGGHYLWRLPE